jgi:hypothetical protein
MSNSRDDSGIDTHWFDGLMETREVVRSRRGPFISQIPRLGLFWFDDHSNTLVIPPTLPYTEVAEDADGNKAVPPDFASTWNLLRSAGELPEELTQEEPEGLVEGRVIHDGAAHRFLVQVASRPLKWDRLKDEVRHAFHLPVQETIFELAGGRPRQPAESLSPAELEALARLNEKLIEIGRRIDRETAALVETKQGRIADPADWLEDFEIECTLSFKLREEDPDHDPNDDNIVAELREMVKYRPLDDGENWNVFATQEGHPMAGQRHCWLFHCLYDHEGLSWRDLLRIGGVWIDLAVILQRLSDRL